APCVQSADAANHPTGRRDPQRRRARLDRAQTGPWVGGRRKSRAPRAGGAGSDTRRRRRRSRVKPGLQTLAHGQRAAEIEQVAERVEAVALVAGSLKLVGQHVGRVLHEAADLADQAGIARLQPAGVAEIVAEREQLAARLSLLLGGRFRRSLLLVRLLHGDGGRVGWSL